MKLSILTGRSIAHRANAAAMIVVVTILACSGFGLWFAMDVRAEVNRLDTANLVLQRQMKADMMHDAIYGDVAAFLAASDAGLRLNKADLFAQLEEHTTTFRDNMAEARQLTDSAAVKQALDEAGPAFEAYAEQAEAVASATTRNPAAVPGSFARFLLSYEQLADQMGAVSGVIEASSTEAANQARYKSLMSILILIVSGVIIFALVVLTAGAVRRHLVNALISMSQAAQQLAQGNYAAVSLAEVEREDEIGQLARGLDALRAFGQDKKSLESAVNEAVNSIHTGSREIAGATEDLTRTTESYAFSINSTAETVKRATESLRETVSLASEASKAMDNTREDATRGGTILRDTIEAINGIERSSAEVTQMINLIESIAFQTNLLALNAGVEAARAGDAGKGFALVANEVRALAQRCAEAAKNITEMITGSADQVNRGVGLVDESGQVFEKIVREMSAISLLVDQIAASSGKEAEELVKLNQDVANLTQETQQNAAMSEQSSAAVVSLATQAASLGKLVSQFRIEDDTPKAHAADEQASGDEPLSFVLLGARIRAHPAPAASDQPAPLSPMARSPALRPLVSGNLAVKQQDQLDGVLNR